MRAIEFRLHDVDRNLTQIYTLNELISKTYRKGKFKFMGRFTGLKDKNGVKLFEGDICDNDIYWDEPHEIGFNYLNAVCAILDGSQYMLNINTLDELEIIGNIHENPELLK